MAPTQAAFSSAPRLLERDVLSRRQEVQRRREHGAWLFDSGDGRLDFRRVWLEEGRPFTV